MTPATIVSLFTLAIAVLLHAVATIWWASKITSNVESIGSTILRFEKEFEKRDTVLKAMWEKIDDSRIRIASLESKNAK